LGSYANFPNFQEWVIYDIFLLIHYTSRSARIYTEVKRSRSHGY